MRSVLLNHGKRINASDMILLSMDGTVLASTLDDVPEGSTFRYDQALRDTRRNRQAMLMVPLQGMPHLLVEAPVLAPLPIARVVMGLRMDTAFAEELRSLSNLEVSFLANAASLLCGYIGMVEGINPSAPVVGRGYEQIGRASCRERV